MTLSFEQYIYMLNIKIIKPKTMTCVCYYKNKFGNKRIL